MLAREKDRPVLNPNLDPGQGKIREGDALPVERPAVAVCADKRCGLVRLDGERPCLERLALYGRLVVLQKGDCVDEPIRSRLVGKVFDAIGIEDVAREGMAIPVLGACELPQILR